MNNNCEAKKYPLLKLTITLLSTSASIVALYKKINPTNANYGLTNKADRGDSGIFTL
ncbi:MAG: hypothetical protein PV340_02055 [Wolbachia sp.]|nr:hypothetical protein [Wolbachia sp.]